MNKFRLVSVLILIAMFFGFAQVRPVAAESTNLIINGSFEEPQLAPGVWQYTYGISSVPVPPWSPWPGSESYPFALVNGSASDGNQYFDFGSSHRTVSDYG